MALVTLAGCSSGSGTSAPTTGGSTGSGSGGQTQAGGASAAGGKLGSGGGPGAGGAFATGGVSANGGAGLGGVATNGGVGAGGAGSGGAVGAGGSSKGGASGNGGVPSSGGSQPVGGSGAGGSTGAGGTTASPDGGPKGTGGSVGGTVSVGASGLPSAGASGQAQPTGSGTTVTVVDWAGFKSALSFTFDDANQTQIDHYKELQALNDKGNNVRYTFYLWTGKNEINNATWPQAVKDGHQLDNHTKSHQSAASTADIQSAEDTIKSLFGVTAYGVAAPNGDASYQTVVPTMAKFLTNRTAGNNGGVLPTDDPSKRQFALPCMIPATGAASSAMQSSISSGISGGKWNIFLVHGFTGGSDGAYQPVAISEFTATVAWAKTQGNIWIDTVENISSYWIAEYGFKKLTATTSGSDKTWTWKTADFNSSHPFPPGKYLRVKTDGGTLKQGSTVLHWDDHGYYEVSLDAGTLTLSSS